MAKRDGRIDSVFADMNVPQRPGAALLVIDHDEIVYSKCYGLADLEPNDRLRRTLRFIWPRSPSSSPPWRL